MSSRHVAGLARAHPGLLASVQLLGLCPRTSQLEAQFSIAVFPM